MEVSANQTLRDCFVTGVAAEVYCNLDAFLECDRDRVVNLSSRLYSPSLHVDDWPNILMPGKQIVVNQCEDDHDTKDQTRPVEISGAGTRH